MSLLINHDTYRNNNSNRYYKSKNNLDVELLRWAVSRYSQGYPKSIKFNQEVDLSNLELNSVDILRTYTRIKYLNLSHNHLNNVDFLSSLYNLLTIIASHNEITKIFENFPKRQYFFKTIDFSFNQISVIPNLENFVDLTIVNLENNYINDLNGLRKCTQLTHLNVSHNMIETLTPLSSVPLIHLNISYNQLISLNGIQKMFNLSILMASNNKIKDVTALSDELENLKIVYIENNMIDGEENLNSIESLPKMEKLNIQNNPLLKHKQMKDTKFFNKLVSQQTNQTTTAYNRNSKPLSPLPLSTSRLSFKYPILIFVGPMDYGKLYIVHKLIEEYPKLSCINIYTDLPSRYCYNNVYNIPHEIILESGNLYNRCRYYTHITTQNFNKMRFNNHFAISYTKNDYNFGISTAELYSKQNNLNIIILELEGMIFLQKSKHKTISTLLMPKDKLVLKERLLQEQNEKMREFEDNDFIQRELNRYRIYTKYHRTKPELFNSITYTDNIIQAYVDVTKTLSEYLTTDQSSIVESDDDDEEDGDVLFDTSFPSRSSVLLRRKQSETPNILRRGSTISLALEKRLSVSQDKHEPIIDESDLKSNELMEICEKNIIGRDKIFRSQFGERLIIYCDYTASGKALRFIEDYIQNEVLPLYANTHTTNTMTSLQTTAFRYEARNIIKKALNCNDEDVVVFAGSGTTGGLHKLIHNVTVGKNTPAPLVIHGPFEHHSNVVPWRYVAEKVRRIGVTNDGHMDFDDLEVALEEFSEIARNENRYLVCSFSAASNVTGILTDTNKVSAIVHKYGGVVFWDYASAAPYITMDMNPVVDGPDKDLVYKDAIVFSTHKFIGGVGTPGVLAAKKFLFEYGEQYPQGAGGGTVFYVGRHQHLYLKDIEQREEGGTPEIVGSIRAGLTVQLKQKIGVEEIEKREEELVKLAWSKFRLCSNNLIVLGGNHQHRIPIFSFLIRQKLKTGASLFLHHNFICVMLNDLFGVQSRSGCACAGPYGMDVMGLDDELAADFMNILMGQDCPTSGSVNHPDNEIMKPGFTRINLPFTSSDCEIKYILDSIIFIVKYGLYFLPLYNFDKRTGSWFPRKQFKHETVTKLSSIHYRKTTTSASESQTKIRKELPTSFNHTFYNAYQILKDISDNKNNYYNDYYDIELHEFSEDELKLRWFILPSEAIRLIENEDIDVISDAPFAPGSLAEAFIGENDEINEKKPNQFKEDPLNQVLSIKDQYIKRGYKEIFQNDVVIRNK